MNSKPSELYKKEEYLRSHKGFYLIEKYKSMIRWKPGGTDSILDVGCGTGDFARECLYPLLPKNFSRYVCSDINLEFLERSRRAMSGIDRVFFEHLDIAADLSEYQLKQLGHFDLVWSFFVLMYIEDQQKAFENMFKLIAKGGSCFLTFTSTSILFDCIYDMAKHPKWSKYLENVEQKYPMTYRGKVNVVENVTRMMEQIGFADIDVRMEKSTKTFETVDQLKGFLSAIPNPFHLMTLEEKEEYLEDITKMASSYGLIDELRDEPISGTIADFLIIVGRK